MCGIAGFFGAFLPDDVKVRKTLDLMKKRGPDGYGQWSGLLGAKFHTLLLHSRLSIQDLNARASQPMVRDGLSLTFNGEIYNFPELREELRSLGHIFQTSGDAEVILAAYQQWGTECTNRFEGMWAFVIVDERQGHVFMSRDRFGEKPLYYWVREEGVYFGSEARFLMQLAGKKAPLNYSHIQRFLVYGYKSLFPSNDEFFHGIKALPAGCQVVLNKPETPKPVSYWQVDYAPVDMSLGEAEEESKFLIQRAIDLRLRADVPIALRLSGGIDSNVALGTAIHKLNRPIHCFSAIEDDPRYDETANILKAVEYHGCKHDVVPVQKENFLDNLYDLVDYFSKPVMTISYYLHAAVSKAIADKGYKVSLGGTGADEIFSGYYDHYLFWLAEMKERQDFPDLVDGWRQTYGKFVRNPFLQDPEAFIKTPESRAHIYIGADRFARFLKDDFQESQYERQYTSALLRNRMLNELYHETVPLMLHEDDLCSMAYSVENRAVYLDSQLVKFISTVPTKHLVHNNVPKHLLRQAGNNIVPDSILYNPRKQGFNAPISSFIDIDKCDTKDRLLDQSEIFDILDRDKFETLLKSTQEMNSESKFLFSIISSKMFIDSHNAFQV